MRVLPSMNDVNNTLLEDAKARLRNNAVVVLKIVTSSSRFAADDIVPSIWSQRGHGKRHRVTSPENIRNVEVTRPMKGTHPTAIDLGDVLQMRCRQDRNKERNTLLRLQEQSRRLLYEQTQDACKLPECAVIWSKCTRVQQHFQGRDHLSSGAHTQITIKTASDSVCRIESACQTRRTDFSNAWTKLVAQAKQLFETTSARNTKSVYGIRDEEANQLMEFELPQLLRRQSVPAIPAPKKVSSGEILITPFAHSPKRVRFDGLLKRCSSFTTIADCASIIAKNIAKKNASFTLVPSVPVTVMQDVKVLLERAGSVSRFNRHSGVLGCGATRLLALPVEIVNSDEDRVKAAHSSLQNQLRQVCLSISTPSISLTSLSLRLPSLWRHPSVENIFRQIKLGQWKLEFAAPETGALLTQHTRIMTTPVSSPSETPVEHETPELHVDANDPEIGRSTNGELALSSVVRQHVTFKIQECASTEELVTSFLRDQDGQEEHDDAPLDRSLSSNPRSSNERTVDSKLSLMIDQLARPALWFLVRLKVMKAHSASVFDTLQSMQLEELETIVFQFHTRLKDISTNPSKTSPESIVETCSTFRHAVWLHILKMIVACHEHSLEAALRVASRLLTSPNYRMAVGVKQILAISNLCGLMGGTPGTSVMHEGRVITETTPVGEPPRKKQKQYTTNLGKMSVRVICDLRLLERDELLEGLSDLNISVVERELSQPIDLIIDERNAVVLLGQEHFSEEQLMRALTYELASSQVQFEKLWIITDGVRNESTLHLFYAALANFAVEVQTFVCKGELEICEVIRGVIDICSETALAHQRILPKMWFARPFVLEEESQLERFLSSTRIINAFGAQSMLHRISIEDLMNKSVEQVTRLIGNSLPDIQADLLLRLLRTSHGIGE